MDAVIAMTTGQICWESKMAMRIGYTLYNIIITEKLHKAEVSFLSE